MKFITAILVSFIAIIPCSAQFTSANLQATGLTCAMCSNAVHKSLEKVSFVQSVIADLKNSAFQIIFRPGNPVSIDALKTAVENAGFFVGSLKLTGNFSETRIASDEHVKIGKDNFHFLSTAKSLLKGEETLTIVDRHFLTEKLYKKYSSLSRKACFKTGRSASCCEEKGMQANERVYHVII